MLGKGEGGLGMWLRLRRCVLDVANQGSGRLRHSSTRKHTRLGHELLLS